MRGRRLPCVTSNVAPCHIILKKKKQIQDMKCSYCFSPPFLPSSIIVTAFISLAFFVSIYPKKLASAHAFYWKLYSKAYKIAFRLFVLKLNTERTSWVLQLKRISFIRTSRHARFLYFKVLKHHQELGRRWD